MTTNTAGSGSSLFCQHLASPDITIVVAPVKWAVIGADYNYGH